MSRALECRLKKWPVRIVPPIIRKYHFSGILVLKSKRTLTKIYKKHRHLRLHIYRLGGVEVLTPFRGLLGCQNYVHPEIKCLFGGFYYHLLFSLARKRFYPQRSSGQAVVTGVVASPRRYEPSLLSRI